MHFHRAAEPLLGVLQYPQINDGDLCIARCSKKIIIIKKQVAESVFVFQTSLDGRDNVHKVLNC